MYITIVSDTIHHQHLIQLEFTIVTSHPENTEWVHCIWVYNLKVNNRSKGGKKLTWVYGPLVWNTSDSLFLLNQGVHWLKQEKKQQQQNEKKKEKKKKKKQHIRFSRENYQHHTIPCKYFMTSDNCVMNIRIIKPGNSLIIGNSHKP